MGMTLWTLKTYGYISSKTKSNQIQRGFLLLFIFLPSKLKPSGHRPSDFPSLTKTQFAQSLDLSYRPNNLNRTPLTKFLASHLMLKPSGNTRVTNFTCYCVTATGVIHSPGSRTC